MAAIHDLLKQIEDLRLRERISREWEIATGQKKFGLVYEQHLPEVLPLYSAKPRRGDLVARRNGRLSETWRVRRIEGRLAHLVRPRQPGDEGDGANVTATVALDELIVVRQFGEPIFPTLTEVGAVHNGPKEAPCHLLIEADNYHALQLLEYTHAGKIDCIYIDPPYNTGAKDWKYNNSYVDENDGWRHSKWLSFMERRLRLAKKLLNQQESVLIVTIDEKEYLHLGLLLNQIFPSSKVQFVTSVINPKGTARQNEFSRVEEYIFFVFIGNIRLYSFGSDMLTSRNYASETRVRWRGLARTGRKGLRKNNPGSWYPIFLRESDWSIHSIGDPVDLDVDDSTVPIPEGTVAIWPPSKKSARQSVDRADADKKSLQYSWSTVPATLRKIWEQGGLRMGRVDPKKSSFPLYYVSSGTFAKIERGEIVVTGRGKQNELLLEYASGQKSAMPRSVWNRALHDAGSHGTALLDNIIPNSGFPFPKSLYVVRDALRFFLAPKKEAVVLDFFAGSGTTLNAVNLLNVADGDEGRRQCILVTNNEVSPEEAEALAGAGRRPGDAEWEARGICRSITWPRSKFTILGRRDDRVPLPGEYATGRPTEQEKPRTFRHLKFVKPADFILPNDLDGRSKARVQREILDKQKAIASLIGLPQNAVTTVSSFIARPGDTTAILFEPGALGDWLSALEDQDQMVSFFIVAADERQYDDIKTAVEELLGPQIVQEEERRPLSAGFPANLAYFKLDFLDKDRVELGTAFREVLPMLWLKAGAKGQRPDLAPGALPEWFAPEDSNFAVLLTEARVKPFVAALRGRIGISKVFVVTDAEEAFRTLSDEVQTAIGAANPQLELVQLYRDYLVNFMINARVDSDQRSSAGAA